ncbi:MAG: hypothetical protein PHF35_03755 [Candidatus Moranbacteria bacterium]|nr:hypothetical protein [Candidatus Moranbacteria bacterium]
MAVVFGLYLFLKGMESRYVSQNENVLSQIETEKSKMNSPEFAEIIDFQNRLNLLDKIIDDHGYWDNMLKNMSGYIIPEARFSSISGKKEDGGDISISIAGIAPNIDAVSRELILLQSFPDLSSLEFENIGELQSTPETGGGGGVNFNVDLKIKDQAFQK